MANSDHPLVQISQGPLSGLLLYSGVQGSIRLSRTCKTLHRKVTESVAWVTLLRRRWPSYATGDQAEARLRCIGYYNSEIALLAGHYKVHGPFAFKPQQCQTHVLLALTVQQHRLHFLTGPNMSTVMGSSHYRTPHGYFFMSTFRALSQNGYRAALRHASDHVLEIIKPTPLGDILLTVSPGFLRCLDTANPDMESLEVEQYGVRSADVVRYNQTPVIVGLTGKGIMTWRPGAEPELTALATEGRQLSCVVCETGILAVWKHENTLYRILIPEGRASLVTDKPSVLVEMQDSARARICHFVWKGRPLLAWVARPPPGGGPNVVRVIDSQVGQEVFCGNVDEHYRIPSRIEFIPGFGLSFLHMHHGSKCLLDCHRWEFRVLEHNLQTATERQAILVASPKYMLYGKTVALALLDLETGVVRQGRPVTRDAMGCKLFYDGYTAKLAIATERYIDILIPQPPRDRSIGRRVARWIRKRRERK